MSGSPLTVVKHSNILGKGKKGMDMILIGVDTGGTFTDLIYQEGDNWRVYKLLSTPTDPAEAVLEGLDHIASGKARHIVHGSTVATNAILERKGARTALITTRGFEDVIEIGRQNRTRLYDLAYRREPPLVDEDLRFGIRERTLSSGRAPEEPDREEIEAIKQKLKASGVESIAVCLLYSFLNPGHENTVRGVLEDLEIPVSLSHEILAEFREYERTSTTVVNAYVLPRMRRYISSIARSLKEKDHLRIMQSNGGSISVENAMNESVRTILSGPAGGAVGAFEIGRRAGFERIITFDMGGTSTDVSLMEGRLSLALESQIAEIPVKMPMIDIHTVGAGGGSVARIDRGGSLRVGPESAGADPGPVCYGRGERITVTDANLFLGRLVPDHFLGGQMDLDSGRLSSYLENMARDIGLSPLGLAEGILAVANTAMEKAIRFISIERGYDPREFTLLGFGGAGGLHAAFLAELLTIPRVLIPPTPGILSALGMLMADIIKDYSFTLMLKQAEIEATELDNLFKDLERRAGADLDREGVDEMNRVMERYLDIRYEGQSYEIIVPFSRQFRESFHALHEKAYGYCNREKPVEVVNVRLRGRGIPQKPGFRILEEAGPEPEETAEAGRMEIFFSSRPYPTRLFHRDKLKAGNRIEGPAVLLEYSSTIVVPPFASAGVDRFGNVILNIRT